MIPRLALAPAPEIPHLRAGLIDEAHVLTPSGEVRLGRLDGVPITLIGEDPPLVRVARGLGAEVLLLVRAARSLDPEQRAGELAVVEDHLSVFLPNPLISPDLDDVGPRFPDMSEPYDRALRALALEEAGRAGLPLAVRVYAAVPDPNLATPAEYRMLRRLGADVVGRDGAPQVIVARHAGMGVLSLLSVTGLSTSGPDPGALVHRIVTRLA